MNYPNEYGSRFLSLEGNEEELVRLMRDAYDNGMTDIERLCRERTSGACDGESSQRVVELINSLL
jgi:hypothetical protein